MQWRTTLAYHLNALVRSLGVRSIAAQFRLSFFLIIALALLSAYLNERTQGHGLITALMLGAAVVALISHQLGIHWLLQQITLLRHHLNRMSTGDFASPITEAASDTDPMLAAVSRQGNKLA